MRSVRNSQIKKADANRNDRQGLPGRIAQQIEPERDAERAKNSESIDYELGGFYFGIFAIQLATPVGFGSVQPRVGQTTFRRLLTS